ncbi:ATP-binding protein [soil metagenome]
MKIDANAGSRVTQDVDRPAATATPIEPLGAVLPPTGRVPAKPIDRSTRVRSESVDRATGLDNMHQLIQLRWIAAFGQIVTIEVVHYGFGIRLVLEPMLAVLAALVAFNIVSHLRWSTGRNVTNGELFVALLVDVGMLTVQLYLSGGAANPFVFLYLLQVTLGAVLLEAWSTWIMLAITGACLATLTVFNRPLAIPVDHGTGLYSPYIQGLLICFALNAALVVVFISRISRNLRVRDARLADLRQRAAEEEHIVRMGLLASGAAHELGTPLSTLAVILGDWRHMPEFKGNPELLQEVGEMQAQVNRCKTIVSGILMSAGEARGESSARTTVNAFLDGLVADWRAARPANALSYVNRFGSDLPMISDSALKQIVGNLLDNAHEASHAEVHLEAVRHGDSLDLIVSDDGPGFTPHMLAHFGKPYQSSKGRPGSGLGIFLVMNVARTLGGSVSAGNRPEGGAVVTLTLPLASITLGDDD